MLSASASTSRRLFSSRHRMPTKQVVDTVIFPQYFNSNLEAMSGGTGLPIPKVMQSMIPHLSQTSLDDIFNKSPAWGRKNIDDMLKQSMQSLAWGLGEDPAFIAATTIKMDVKETPSTFELSYEVPGCKKKDLKLEINGDCLVLSADRDVLKKEEGENFKRVERFYGRSTRSINVPPSVSLKDISTHLEHGVLSVKLKKLPEEEVKHEERVIEIA